MSQLKDDIIEVSNATTRIIFDDALDDKDNQDYLGIKNDYPKINVAEIYYDKLLKQMDSWGYTQLKWSDLININIFSHVAQDCIEELQNNIEETEFLKEEAKSINPAIIEEFKSKGVLPYEDIDKHSIIGDLHIDEDLMEAKSLGKKALVYDAFTGAGKSLSLDKWVASRSLELDSGIILTHTNAEAWKHYNNIITWNPLYKDHIFVFNSDIESEYKKVLRNPELLNQYNWVICFQSRLLSSDVDVLFTCLKNLDDRRRLRNDTRTYILSDECIPSADEQVLKKKDIVNIDQVSNYAFTEYIKNPTSYESRRKLTSYFYALETRINELKDPKELTHEDSVVLSAFNSRTNISNSSIYQLKVYMARFNTLLNFMFNRFDEFIRKYEVLPKDPHEEVLIQYYPKISEIGLGHDLIIFDATARINYGYNNPYFHVKTIARLPSNVLDFNILDISFPKRNELTKKEFDNFFDKLYKSGFKFKDNSIVIWNMCPWFTDRYSDNEVSNIYKNESTKRYSVVKLKEFINKTGSKGCLVAFFNGGEIKGENRFSSCNNVYILSNYKIDNEALYQARNSMMNSDYWNKNKFLGDVIQCIGRGAVRNQRSIIQDNQSGVMNIYLSKDVSPDYILSLLEYYEINKNRIKWSTESEFDKWVEVMITNAIKGPSIKLNDKVKSSFIGNRSILFVNEVVKYLCKKYYEGIFDVSASELCKRFYIKKVELNQFMKIIEVLNFLNIKMKIYTKYNSIYTESYKDLL